MTKVTLRYDLSRPLGEDDLANIARVHSTYGIARVEVAATLDRIVVDYDASRLLRKEVESVLARNLIPIRTAAQAH